MLALVAALALACGGIQVHRSTARRAGACGMLAAAPVAMADGDTPLGIWDRHGRLAACAAAEDLSFSIEVRQRFTHELGSSLPRLLRMRTDRHGTLPPRKTETLSSHASMSSGIGWLRSKIFRPPVNAEARAAGHAMRNYPRSTMV